MRCFTVLGPSQIGKSTLVERVGSLGGEPKKSVTPYGLGLTEFEFGGEAWCALDVPGNNEALAHAQHALLASDACVLCVSPILDEAVSPPLIAHDRGSGTPCILFINRMDEPRGRIRDIVAALQDFCSRPLILRQIPIRTATGSSQLRPDFGAGPGAIARDTPSSLSRYRSAVEREHRHARSFRAPFGIRPIAAEELIETREPAATRSIRSRHGF